MKVTATAEAAADGTLLVMEGWAERETSDRVDALLDEYPNVLYIKSDPTPEDETPVKLKNNRFARIFEMVGDMYARPKYGTIDLTPFFAPSTCSSSASVSTTPATDSSCWRWEWRCFGNSRGA